MLRDLEILLNKLDFEYMIVETTIYYDVITNKYFIWLFIINLISLVMTFTIVEDTLDQINYHDHHCYKGNETKKSHTVFQIEQTVTEIEWI